MNGYDNGQELIEALEMLEQTLAYEEDDDEGVFYEEDDMEARRGRSRSRRPSSRTIGRVRPPSRAASRPSTVPRPSGSYVTQTQFTIELQRIRTEMKKSAEDVTRAINTTINKINAVNKAQDVQLNEISARQKRDMDRLKRQTKQSQDMFMIMTLLQDKPKLVTTKVNDVDVVTGYDPNEKDSLLPILLLSGMGDVGDKDDSQDSGSMNTVLLALALSDKL